MDINKTIDYGLIGFIKDNGGLLKSWENFEKKVVDNFPTEKDDHFFFHIYQEQYGSSFDTLHFYIELCNFLEFPTELIFDLRRNFFDIHNSDLNRNPEKFKKQSGYVKRLLSTADKLLMERLSLLDKLECFRMAEAMKCLENKTNLSAVIMAVSSVEHRLHKIINESDRKIYEKEFKKSTLGAIIHFFKEDYSDSKHKKIKGLLPEKHKPLMEVFNVYRIFSAHPKEEIISNQTARDIVSLSFLFLIDPDLKVLRVNNRRRKIKIEKPINKLK